MIRVRTKHNRARFYRAGLEFGRAWRELTEPGDPGQRHHLTAEQAATIRAETRFLEIEEVTRKGKGAKTSSGSSVQGDDPAAQAAGESSGIKESQPVNVNTASAAEIAAAAAGIGQATARDLVKHRKAGGPFASLDDLIRVGGIGQATIDRNRDRLTV